MIDNRKYVKDMSRKEQLRIAGTIATKAAIEKSKEKNRMLNSSVAELTDVYGILDMYLNSVRSLMDDMTSVKRFLLNPRITDSLKRSKVRNLCRGRGNPFEDIQRISSELSNHMSTLREVVLYNIKHEDSSRFHNFNFRRPLFYEEDANKREIASNVMNFFRVHPDSYVQRAAVTRRGIVTGQTEYYICKNIDGIVLEHPDCREEEFDFGNLTVAFQICKDNSVRERLLDYRVWQSEGNTTVSGGYYHPHVNNLGQTCEGDASGQITDCLSRGLLVSAFDIIKQILNTYNPESPFVEIEAFLERGECSVCGSRTDEDLLYCCEECAEHVCSDCSFFDDIDDYTYCIECHRATHCESCGVTTNESFNIKYCKSCGDPYCINCCEEGVICDYCGEFECYDCSTVPAIRDSKDEEEDPIITESVILSSIKNTCKDKFNEELVEDVYKTVKEILLEEESHTTRCNEHRISLLHAIVKDEVKKREKSNKLVIAKRDVL